MKKTASFSKWGKILLIAPPLPLKFPKIKDIISSLGLENFIFFKRHFSFPEDFLSFISEIKKIKSKPLLAIDQEGGPVVRIAPPLAPYLASPWEISQKKDPEKAIKEHALTTIKILKTWHINMNLAPVIDIRTEKTLPFLAERTLGTHPEKIALLAQIYIKILKQQKILCCAKHFPGLGKAKVDPHKELVLLEEIDPVALKPFQEVIKAQVPAIMTTHVIISSLSNQPVTFSKKIIKILRNNLGFQGAILTDDLQMGAIKKHYSLAEALLKSFLAGHDLLLICEDFWKAIDHIREFFKEIQKSPSLQKRMDEAIKRIDLLKRDVVLP